MRTRTRGREQHEHAPRARRGRARARLRGSRGSSLVEAAIVAPLFFLLIFGVIEAGYAYYGKLTVNNMSVAGARSGSGEANEVLADFAILEAVENAASGISNSSIKLVVIYRATSPNDEVPSSCKTASVTNTLTVRGCNRYTGADLSLAESQFGCDGPPGPTVKIDDFWCPTTRKVAMSGTNGPPDYIGVYVEARHNTLAGIFGSTFTFRTDTVIRIEPRTLT